MTLAQAFNMMKENPALVAYRGGLMRSRLQSGAIALQFAETWTTVPHDFTETAAPCVHDDCNDDWDVTESLHRLELIIPADIAQDLKNRGIID